VASPRADKTAIPDVVPQDVMLQEPGVLEPGDGRLWMWMRTDAGVQYECFSADGGEHWSSPKPGRSPRRAAGHHRADSWIGRSALRLNDHSGWHAFPPGKRTPLCPATSTDDGRTWSPSCVIEGNPDGWYCYTSMTFVKDRVILTYAPGTQK
jgi:hypothetical protein